MSLFFPDYYLFLIMWSLEQCWECGKAFKVQSVLPPYWGETKFQKGKVSDTKERSDPYAYSDILSGHHFFNLRGMKS